MKTNITFQMLPKVLRLLLWVILPLISQAQPDYVFRNAELEYGTDLQVGARYRFRDVRPGMDAIIEIKDMTGGMTLSQLDGGSGFDEAFQPYINCAPKKKGYVEFELNLVAPGTDINVIATELPLTAIDIDGWEFPDDKLYETDEFQKSASFYTMYDMLGTNLDIKETASWASAINKSAITYDGIDTIQRDVMYTAVHASVTTVLFRVGADNKSKEPMTRLRSIYFKKFSYATGVLPLSILLDFSGSANEDRISLQWTYRTFADVKTETLEASETGRSFYPVMSRGLTGSGANLQWKGNMTAPAMYYRLKFEHMDGQVEYSRILMFKSGSLGRIGVKIYPNIVQDNATLQFQAPASELAAFALYDQSGRMVRQQRVTVSKGLNNIPLTHLGSLQRGQYYVVVYNGTEKHTGKIIKQ